jgi:hypothetical protein
MDQDHGPAKPPLQVAKAGQQGNHFAGIVLVAAVPPHEQIEQEQPGP